MVINNNLKSTKNLIICFSSFGDSGCPLMHFNVNGKPAFWYVAGIVSYGIEKCGLDGVPGVYTKVSHYVDWIKANVRA